jgi:predicted Zn-dependent peptidase
MVEDTPDEQIHDLFHRLFWVDHPLGMSILGTADTVKTIDRQLILDHLKKFYTPERIVIAAAGNINHNEIVELFAPIFESLEQAKSSSPVDIPRINSDISCIHKPLEQVHVCLGGKAPHLSSDLRFAVAVLNNILGGNMSSRLFQEIREKRGLAYSIYSFLSAYMDTGLLGICVGTDPREVNSVLAVISREIEKVQNGEVSQSDLDEARRNLVGVIILGSESTDSRMMRLAKNEFVFGRYVSYEEVIEDLGRVTVDEVIACAAGAFAAGNVSLATLGPIKKEELDLTGFLFSRAEKSDATKDP